VLGVTAIAAAIIGCCVIGRCIAPTSILAGIITFWGLIFDYHNFLLRLSLSTNTVPELPQDLPNLSHVVSRYNRQPG
jgi:hypothetical protein